MLRNTLYPVGCQRSGEALINDPERDIDRYRELAAENGLRITAVAETHIHADFVSGGREFAHDPDVNRRTSMRRSFQCGGVLNAAGGKAIRILDARDDRKAFGAAYGRNQREQ
jgi:glyoxylase-like metal-dependent hydrolase (beta-lactamase superfamily II)